MFLGNLSVASSILFQRCRIISTVLGALYKLAGERVDCCKSARLRRHIKAVSRRLYSLSSSSRVFGDRTTRCRHAARPQSRMQGKTGPQCIEFRNWPLSATPPPPSSVCPPTTRSLQAAGWDRGAGRVRAGRNLAKSRRTRHAGWFPSGAAPPSFLYGAPPDGIVVGGGSEDQQRRAACLQRPDDDSSHVAMSHLWPTAHDDLDFSCGRQIEISAATK